MIFIDDFLSRTWWDPKPYPHGLGTNIPYNYEAMTIEEEWDTLKTIHAMGIPITLFMVGYVLEMKETQDAIKWVVNNKIPIAGHGYYHTEQEYLDGYKPWAEKALKALERTGQKPPYLWRFPRHENINDDYIKRLGFVFPEYHYFLDPELREKNSLDVLKGHDHHNAWVHSVYLTQVHNASLNNSRH